MPVSPADTIDLARAIARLYEEAEQALLALLARALGGDPAENGWARRKLAAVRDVQQGVRRIVDALQRDATGAVRGAVAEAYRRGQQAAVAELGALAEGHRRHVASVLPGAARVDRLANAMLGEQGPVWARILREPLDAYRSIIARVSANTLLGGLTRQQTAQRALDQFAARGISSFTDKAGRRWEMASYAEMAVRSVTARAAIAGHVDQLTALGWQLVIVSAAPLECPLCRPWEGKILSINGLSRPHELPLRHATDDAVTVTVHVAGSLVEARGAGLLHPNCRHNISAYLPGVTRQPQSPPHPHGATYEDTQQQRHYERQVRAWKRRAAAAMTDAERRRAQAKVRTYQARIRELTTDKGLQRRRDREQITSAR